MTCNASKQMHRRSRYIATSMLCLGATLMHHAQHAMLGSSTDALGGWVSDYMSSRDGPGYPPGYLLGHPMDTPWSPGPGAGPGTLSGTTPWSPPGIPARPARARPGKFPGREIPGRPGARAGGEISPRKSRPGGLPGTPREPPPGTHFWASQGHYIHILLQLTPLFWGVWEGAFFTPPGGCPRGWPGPPPGRPGRGKKVHIFLGI